MFFKKDALENFAQFTGRYLYWNLFFNKVGGWGPATVPKRISGTGLSGTGLFL